jgi:hypothetical protein
MCFSLGGSRFCSHFSGETQIGIASSAALTEAGKDLIVPIFRKHSTEIGKVFADASPKELQILENVLNQGWQARQSACGTEEQTRLGSASHSCEKQSNCSNNRCGESTWLELTTILICRSCKAPLREPCRRCARYFPDCRQSTTSIHNGVSQYVRAAIIVIISHLLIAVAELQRAPRLSHSGYRASIWS